MFRWILAAVGMLVVSIGMSAAYLHLSSTRPRPPYDPVEYETYRQIYDQYERVSLIGLLGDPRRYDQHKVQVEGFVTLGFEDAGLHLDESAYRAGLRQGSVWLDQPKWRNAEAARRLHRHYGRVAGTFNASGRGHMGAYSGSLTDLRRIEPIFTEADFQELRRQEMRALMVQTIFFSGWFLAFVGWMMLAVIWVSTRRRA